MNNYTENFCVISINGNFNKFSSNFSKLNPCHCFSINSHEKLNEIEFKEKTKNYPNIIIVSALGGNCANKLLLNILEILKNKNCLVVSSTPFDFEGKKRIKIANEMLEILKEKETNCFIFYSRNFFKKWKEEDLASFKNIYSFINLQIVKTINSIINANSFNFIYD